MTTRLLNLFIYILILFIYNIIINISLSDSVYSYPNKTDKPSFIMVTPEQFGAVGDGVNDDSDAFSKMFEQSTRLHITLTAGKTYLIDKPNISFLYADSVIIDGNNASINMNTYFLTITSGYKWIDGAHTGWNNSDLNDKLINNSLFNSDFVEGTNWIEIANVRDWEAKHGDLLCIITNEVFKGQTLVIDQVDSINNKIYFQDQIRENIERSDIIQIRYVNSGSKYIQISDLLIKNGGLRLSGFESVYTTNVSCEMDDQTYNIINENHNWDINAHAGLTTFWNKNVKIIGGRYSGYLILGNGYGISVGMSDLVEIDEINGSDCRHVVTTSTTAKGGNLLNKLIINNSNAYFTNKSFEAIPSNITAWDTHIGVEEMLIDSCFVDGAELFSKLRGNNITITNSEVKNTHVIVYAAHSPAHNKKNIIIKNCNFINSGTMVVYRDASFENITIENVLYHFSNPIAAIYADTKTATIKKLSIVNSKFLGSDSTYNRIFINQYPQYNNIRNAIIIDSEFQDISEFFYFRNSPIQNLVFKNNIVTGSQDIFIRSQELDITLDKHFSNYEFTGNKFNNLDRILTDWGPKKIGDWTWSNNEFKNCSTPLFFKNATFLSLNISFNTFEGNNSGCYIGADSGNVIVSGNDIILGNSKNITSLKKGELNFNGNLVSYDCAMIKEKIHSGEAKMNIRSNTYKINSHNTDFANIVNSIWNFSDNFISIKLSEKFQILFTIFAKSVLCELIL